MRITEDAILGRIVTVLVEDGFRVELSDQDGGGLHVYASPDNGDITVDGAYHWLRLTPGNDEACGFITDYSVNLEETLKPVFEFIADLEKLLQ